MYKNEMKIGKGKRMSHSYHPYQQKKQINERERKYVMDTGMTQPFTITERPRLCKNGHKNCIYLPCDNLMRPIYGYEGYTSCGRSFKDEFCTHAFCHDNRLRLAKGDAAALRAQMHLNETGEYRDLPPLNYKKEGDKIVITKELQGRDVKASIYKIDWDKNEALIYLRDGGPLTGGIKLFQHVPIHKDFFMPTRTQIMKSLMNGL